MNIELAILTLYVLGMFILGQMVTRWQERQRWRREQEMVQARRRIVLRRLSQWDGPSRPKR